MNVPKVARWQRVSNKGGGGEGNKRNDEEMKCGAAKLETKAREVLIERGHCETRDKPKETVYKWRREKDNHEIGESKVEKKMGLFVAASLGNRDDNRGREKRVEKQ